MASQELMDSQELPAVPQEGPNTRGRAQTKRSRVRSGVDRAVRC